jgi:hypothetical protein
MACVPGTPCFENTSNAYYPKNCDNGWFAGYPIPTSSIQYNGPNLPNSGVDTGDGMNIAMQKLDNALDPIELVQTLITVINQNPSLQVMFCTLVNSCIYTTTTTTTVTPTTTSTTSSSTSTTTTTTTASVASQGTISSTTEAFPCQGIGGSVTVFYNGNVGLPSAPLYTDPGLTIQYNSSFFGNYIRLFFNGEYNVCTMSGNIIQSYTPCPTTTTTTTTIP